MLCYQYGGIRCLELDTVVGHIAELCCMFVKEIEHSGEHLAVFFFCINAMQKAPASTGAFFDRQLPTLPGRRQPSTIGLCVLNCCVRNGNRWNHAGIVTECVRKHSCSLKTIQKKVTEHLSPSRITYYLSGQRLFLDVSLISQALGQLVLVRSTPCRASTPSLSTSSSSRGLTAFT